MSQKWPARNVARSDILQTHSRHQINKKQTNIRWGNGEPLQYKTQWPTGINRHTFSQDRYEEHLNMYHVDLHAAAKLFRHCSINNGYNGKTSFCWDYCTYSIMTDIFYLMKSSTMNTCETNYNLTAEWRHWLIVHYSVKMSLSKHNLYRLDLTESQWFDLFCCIRCPFVLNKVSQKI